jgi:hypothetical protein
LLTVAKPQDITFRQMAKGSQWSRIRKTDAGTRDAFLQNAATGRHIWHRWISGCHRTRRGKTDATAKRRKLSWRRLKTPCRIWGSHGGE